MITCRSCGAEVSWVVLTTGRKMPLDPAPVANGTVILSKHDGRGTVIAPGTPMPVGVPRFAPHFATCPHAAQHRRTR